MTAGSSPNSHEPKTNHSPPAAKWLRSAAEILLFALVAFAPWPYASVEPFWEFVLYSGVALLTLLWLAHSIVTRNFTYRSDPISICLLGIILLSVFQLVPLPVAAVRILSPTLARWNDTLRPEVADLFPGESDAGA